jgi:septin 7
MSVFVRSTDNNLLVHHEEVNKNSIGMKSFPSTLNSTSNSTKKLEMKEFVGFSSLPKQICRRAFQKPFVFNLLVVGGSGLGKSTLINSMFLADIYSKQNIKRIEKTLNVEAHLVELEENGVKLSLAVIDSPGFGDAVDNTNHCNTIVEYVEKQLDDFLQTETSLERATRTDSRVHACLYFIAPNGHGLKRMDLEFMEKLHKKVNIIPVIGKADVLTKTELEAFKNKVYFIGKKVDNNYLF